MIGWERELTDPSYRPPSFYMTMTRELAERDYGFPPPPATPRVGVVIGVKFTAYDDSEWEWLPIEERWHMMGYPPGGDPYQIVKDNERKRRQHG